MSHSEFRYRHNAYFVDLFVRSSNNAAIAMYEHFGYTVYRRVVGYYSGATPEDALGMETMRQMRPGGLCTCLLAQRTDQYRLLAMCCRHAEGDAKRCRKGVCHSAYQSNIPQ